MPLDSTGFRDLSKSLSQLGVVPISDERATQWQTYMTEKFAAKSKRNRHLVDADIACWRSIGSFELSMFSQTPLGRKAPFNVRQLADKIAIVHPDVDASIAVFDRDPILYVHIDGRRYPIAIWDGGVIRAIAEGADLSIGQRVRRMVAKLV